MDNIIQGSDDWHALRLGKVTASRVSDVTAKVKTGTSASRTNYMAQLIAERLTGSVEATYTNGSMQWGNEQEPEARLAYQFHANELVEQVAFVAHPSIEMTGASPDGLVGADGLVEIKCPNTSTHIDTMLSGKAPTKYIKQMMWQMACTGRKWCDFVSFDPRMPEEMRLFVKRVERDDALIASLEAEVSEFLCEINDKITALKNVCAPSLKEAA